MMVHVKTCEMFKMNFGKNVAAEKRYILRKMSLKLKNFKSDILYVK